MERDMSEHTIYITDTNGNRRRVVADVHSDLTTLTWAGGLSYDTPTRVLRPSVDPETCYEYSHGGASYRAAIDRLREVVYDATMSRKTQ